MTSINTIEDFLRVLRENDDLRSAVRRELLTEELLALPGRFSEMLETQNAMLEEQRSLRRDFDSLQKTQNAMLEEQRSLRQDTDSLQKTQNAMLREQVTIRRDIQALHGMFRRQHDDFARFRGNYAIDAARRNSYQIARPFFRQKGMRRVEFSTLDSTVLNDMLSENYEALDALNFSDDTLNSFPEADLVISVTDRMDSTQRFYIAVEASFTGHNHDVRRATDRARILRCATGLGAYAVVAAVRLDQHIDRVRILDGIEEYLKADDEETALWYPLPESDLEPQEPY